jgi:hypothetical protein
MKKAMGCGALFTFSDQYDMHKFVTTMMYKLRKVVGICVQLEGEN